MRVLVFLLTLACVVSAAEDWGPAKLLIGHWVGEGSGTPGEATGGFSFQPDLQGAIVIRKNYADYPARGNSPAFRHDDLMILHRDEVSRKLRATYFDSEGHAILYTVSDVPHGVEFLSDGGKDTVRYRLTYREGGQNKLIIRFEIAPPGKDFASYIEARAHRQ